ncbi:ATP-binding protein [Phenylobacterium sp.]|uniref:ATP-binding protein n=1 Tax=Phenylobacterium sp. TaxID=1871053 RepID=UPI00120BF58D|nr:ATP-binding protein [Phenylobacterium sp.]THD64617.1 MAG: response regulator [Phenylobacterium sp.]
MKPKVWEFARERAARATGEIGMSAYHLTLTSLVQPLAFHFAFNAIVALSMVMLGHPIAAAATLAIYCAVDVANQFMVRRWIETAADTPDDDGFRRLAPLCAARMTGYVLPTLLVALNGHRGESTLFLLQAATLVAVAISASLMGRRIFWAFLLPIVGALGVLIAFTLTPWVAAAAFLALASLTALTGLMMEGITRTVQVLHGAFNDNVAMIPELKAARDQAVAERAAADAAREEARQAGRAKANFLATMSHEIRTPMNGVLGMAQLLQRDETDAAQKARLDVLIDSGEYLLSILNDILDVSKIDAGRLDILPAAEDLSQFLERLVGFWGPRADEKGVALVLEVAPNAPAFALFDALRLRQVLFNLVGNALKFTDKGSVTVAADASPNGEGAVLLHLAVRDTGIGIAADNLPQLFTRFTQADESEMRKFGGTGLGLAIAKQLVELMGGRIWAESTLGQGSVFHIKLPLALANGPALTVARNDAGPAEAPCALQVLAVDDNAVNLLVLDQLLSSFGHEVAKASSGAEALEALAERPFDLILLDIQMPGMTGVEVLQRLHAAEGPNRDAPVVALTADVTSGGRQRYLELGFTEHCPKPIQIQELVDAIGRAMSAPSARRQAAA